MRESTAALTRGEFLAPAAVARGVTLWREHGLQTVDLMVQRYLGHLSAIAPCTVVEHDFLRPADAYDRVFGDHRNVYTAVSSKDEVFVLRADNMPDNVDLLRRGDAQIVVATGGLLRRFDGPVRPLYREQYIWPAVQVSQLASPKDAAELLRAHQAALTTFLADLALSSVSVEPDETFGYGERMSVTVTVTRNGRPTVLTTAYLMSAGHRARLGLSAGLVDVGWTGKILDVLVDVHRDSHGVCLPSTISPVQLTVIPPATGLPSPEGLQSWLKAVAAAGIRLEMRPRRSPSGRRAEERRAFARGCPLVVGFPGGDRPTVVASRIPPRRRLFASPPAVDVLVGELRAHDGRLRERAARRTAQSLDGGAVVPRCPHCDEDPHDRYGRVDRACPPCSRCGGLRTVLLKSPTGRFY